IGAAAGFGLVLAGLNSKATQKEGLLADLQTAADVLLKTRPTAVNLSWAINHLINQVKNMPGNVKEIQQGLLMAAKNMADADIEINKKLAQYGADLIQDGDHIVHHCNTGALAVVDWGTALGVIRTAFEQGKRIHVFVDETRPRLQGSRLTAWELEQYGIPYDIIIDSASGYLIRSGQVQKVLFGADRVAANGDVANKIGTYMLALAAYDNGIPAYSVFPTSTVDLNLESGDQIEIEERDQMEVLNIQINGEMVSPTGASARNPAFDITPNRLISALVTEKGIIYPPYFKNLSDRLKA
ncbi:MAG: S-methyl-5-thioribose-1-phosphate isomerase, partial [Anaerolineaceae bacterium]|nr:S-methyl-5-thioribose-1-phosphate isomerase [Anaerolineaceae bacterium]